MPITRDATSGWYCPANAAEWAALVNGTAVPVPNHVWPMQDPGAPYIDTIGSINLGDEGIRHDNAVTVPGWSRVGQRSRGDGFITTSGLLPDPATTSYTLLAIAITEGTGVTSQNMSIGIAGTYTRQFVTSSGVHRLTTASSIDGVVAIPSTAQPIILQTDFSTGNGRLVTDVESLTRPIGSPSSREVAFSGNLVPNSVVYMYCAAWTGAAGEMSAATLSVLASLVKNGPVVFNWPYTNRLPEFRTSSQRAGFVEVVLTATPAAAEWTAVDLDVFGRPSRAPSRNRS